MTANETALKKQKHEYYERSDIVEEYEESRFGTPSGLWIRSEEQEAISALIAMTGTTGSSIAVDLATGTGRNVPILGRAHQTVIGCDISLPMLMAASKRADGRCVNCDAAKIPIASESVDCVLASRFFFHFDDLSKFLSEISRILKPGGALIFDVCNWTPRTWIPGTQNRLGGRMFLHRRQQVEALAKSSGFIVTASRGAFFMPPFLYQHLPLWLVRFVDFAAGLLLLRYPNKVYYLLLRGA